MKLQVLGIDLAKNVFHLVGLDASGQVMIRKRCLARSAGGKQRWLWVSPSGNLLSVEVSVEAVLLIGTRALLMARSQRLALLLSLLPIATLTAESSAPMEWKAFLARP